MIFSCIDQKQIKNEFFENGRLKKEIIYNNKRDTTSFVAKGYYETGQLKYTTTFKNGKREGEYCYYFRNGVLKENLHFSNGLLDGIQKIYNMNNELGKETLYLKGKLIIEKIYRKNIKYHLNQAQIYIVEDSIKKEIGVITYDSTNRVIEAGSFFYDVIGPDTVKKGTKTKYLIKFYNKRDDIDFRLVIGKLKPNLSLSDTLFDIVTKEDCIEYSFIPVSTGKKLILGIVYLRSDSNTIKLPFYKDYFVIDKFK